MEKRNSAKTGAGWLYEFVATQSKQRKEAGKKARTDLIRGAPRRQVAKGVVRTRQGSVAFRIMDRADGGPVRPISRGAGGKRLTGLAYSRKNGRMLGWESRNELHALRRFEVLTSIASYREQPHRLTMVVGEKQMRFTPDVECRLADGAIQIVEVKDKFEVERDPDYALKLDVAAAVYEQLEWAFVILEKAEIEQNPTFKAIDEIYAHATVGFRDDQVRAVRDHLKAGESTIGRICAALGELPRQILFPMMVERHIEIDLTRPLGPESCVRLCSAEVRR